MVFRCRDITNANTKWDFSQNTKKKLGRYRLFALHGRSVNYNVTVTDVTKRNKNDTIPCFRLLAVYIVNVK